MADSDLQISFGADVSGVEAGIDQAKDALGGLDPVLQGLSAPMLQFQTACTQAAASSAQAASAVQQHWTASLGVTSAMFARNIDSLLRGTETFSQAFLRMGDQMLSRFLGWCLEMAERWAVKELTQSAASAAGAAVRTSTDLAAQSTGLAVSAATAAADIGASASRAAAGAYAAVAATPIVGPFLAPAAAASALAAVLAFGDGLYSAEGGWGQVAYDGALTSLHRNEMVLPASIASPLRAMVAGGAVAGSGGSGASASGSGAGSGAVHHHWNIQALDAKSFARFARSNPDAITGALTSAAQRLGVTAQTLSARGAR